MLLFLFIFSATHAPQNPSTSRFSQITQSAQEHTSNCLHVMRKGIDQMSDTIHEVGNVLEYGGKCVGRKIIRTAADLDQNLERKGKDAKRGIKHKKERNEAAKYGAVAETLVCTKQKIENKMISMGRTVENKHIALDWKIEDVWK